LLFNCGEKLEYEQDELTENEKRKRTAMSVNPSSEANDFIG
jgi:hypothetical protein